MHIYIYCSIIKKHIFSVGSLNCFVILKDEERLYVPVMTVWKEGNALFNDALNTFYLRLDIRDSRYSWVVSVTQTSWIACLMFSTLASCFQRLPHVFNACLMFSTLASCFQRLPHVFNACLVFSTLASCFQRLPQVFEQSDRN